MSYAEEAELDALRAENKEPKEENRVLRAQKHELLKMVSFFAEAMKTK